MRVIIVFIMTCAVASAACADECDWTNTAGLSCTGMKITICPRGDFDQIRYGCGGSSDYIWIEARDCSNTPIPGIPWTDYWIGACDAAQALFYCAEPIAADSLTGANGRTTFSGVIRAGGCVLTGGVYMAIQGMIIKAPPLYITPLCLNVIIKGPDLTGASGHPDGFVNLSDLVPFGTSFNKNLGQAGFNTCCDFNDDDKCNLSDFAFFGTHYQHRCQ